MYVCSFAEILYIRDGDIICNGRSLRQVEGAYTQPSSLPTTWINILIMTQCYGNLPAYPMVISHIFSGFHIYIISNLSLVFVSHSVLSDYIVVL